MVLRRSHRWLLVPVTAIILTTFSNLSGAAEFSAETIIDQLGQKQKVKMRVKGQQIRVEMRDTFGQKQILISRSEQNPKTFMLYPETKTYLQLPAAAVQSPVALDEDTLRKIGKKRLVGQENIEGYSCDKYEITYYNKYLGQMIVWFARKLNYPIQMIQVDGPTGNSVNRRLTNIKEHSVPDTLFTVPEGYKQVKKPQGDCRAGYCRINFF